MNKYQRELLEKSMEKVPPITPYITERETQELITKIMMVGFLTETEDGFYRLRSGVEKMINNTFPEILDWWEDSINFLPYCTGPLDREKNLYLASLTEIVHRFVKGRNQQKKIDELGRALKYEFEKEIYVILAVFVAQKALKERLIAVKEGKILIPLEKKVEHAMWNTGKVSAEELITKLETLYLGGYSIEEILNKLAISEGERNHQEDYPFDI